ncbi:kynurenine formamidase [Anthonomus grandis grandis]|uniref:kynurenine formamidase n=1 Tax=Anthonomus grandis grandis TaxID=2921223 RepID=UPI00216602F3|nr:kynurenine formamidase [Anthonomus grandis grandis]
MASSETNIDLETLYSPSRWSKRMNQEQVLKKHIEFLDTKSREVKEKIPCDLDIPYGTGDCEKFSIYGTNLNDGSPLLIHIHGGYYQEKSLSYSNNGFISNIFCQNGIKTVLLGYDLSPQKSVEEILESLKVGVAKCIKYARTVKSEAIFISGHSVGAHAIATILADLKKSLPEEDARLIKAIFLICGIYNLVPITKMSANDLLNLSEQRALQLSPALLPKISYGSTVVYVIAAENDSPAFVEQSKEFTEKLKRDGNEVHLRCLDQVDHFDVVENLYYEDFELTKLMLNVINNKTDK